MRYLLLFLFLPLCSETIRVRPFDIRFKSPTASDLHQGYVEIDPDQLDHLVRIDVREQDEEWKLYIRAGQEQFDPGSYTKSTRSLLWKFNSESATDYRHLTTNKSLVHRQRNGDRKTIRLDFRCLVGWEDKPAPYEADVEFILKLEDDD